MTSTRGRESSQPSGADGRRHLGEDDRRAKASLPWRRVMLVDEKIKDLDLFILGKYFSNNRSIVRIFTLSLGTRDPFLCFQRKPRVPGSGHIGHYNPPEVACEQRARYAHPRAQGV